MSVYTADQFISVYQVPQTIYYTDTEGNSTSKVVTGYKNEYNYDDPIIRCHKEGGTCSYNKSYTQSNSIFSYENLYKVYLAPGTFSANLAVFLSGQTSQCVAIARLGQPPTADYASFISSLTDDGFLQLSYSPVSQAKLHANDCIVRNSAGILSLVGSGFSVTSESDGGWLYVILVLKTGGVLNISNTISVSMSPFMNWFRTKTWSDIDDPADGSSSSVTVFSDKDFKSFHAAVTITLNDGTKLSGFKNQYNLYNTSVVDSSI